MNGNMFLSFVVPVLYNFVPLVLIFSSFIYSFGEPGSSVSIVSDYGLDGQDSIPDRGRGFFL
jgi:hypothetical protein